ncbi:MAG: hypothetical protein Q4A37_01995 [Candidatus Saccharibacteria bacterium]|nr:hypothetical protein [Candidatus Saccharibacteria bacterium]
MKPKVDTTTQLNEPFSWQAPEGMSAHRTVLWYIVFGVLTLGLMLLSIFLIKSWTFAILVPIMAVAVLLAVSRPPRMINYAVSPKGVYVADKLYDFSEFRAFGVMLDPQQPSIILLPVRRFSPGLTLYFSEAEGERIVDMLGARLPMQEVTPDAIEKFIRAIKLY